MAPRANWKGSDCDLKLVLGATSFQSRKRCDGRKR
jgi:hypothetical protein